MKALFPVEKKRGISGGWTPLDSHDLFLSLPSVGCLGGDSLAGYAVEPRDGLKLGTDLNLGGSADRSQREMCLVVFSNMFYFHP